MNKLVTKVSIKYPRRNHVQDVFDKGMVFVSKKEKNSLSSNIASLQDQGCNSDHFPLCHGPFPFQRIYKKLPMIWTVIQNADWKCNVAKNT